MEKPPKTISILDLIQIGVPPIGKRILLHEIRPSTRAEYWSVGTVAVSKKGNLYMGIEGQSGIAGLSKKSRWVPLPESNEQPYDPDWEQKDADAAKGIL